jgi:hypothetical protein
VYAFFGHMGDLAVLTPSFRGDADLFADLHSSVLANTESSAVHHVVVPPSDASLFRQYEVNAVESGRTATCCPDTAGPYLAHPDWR